MAFGVRFGVHGSVHSSGVGLFGVVCHLSFHFRWDSWGRNARTCFVLALRPRLCLFSTLSDLVHTREAAAGIKQRTAKATALLNAVRDGLGSLQYSLLLLEYKHDRAPYAAPVPPPLDTLVGAPASQEQRDYRWELFDKSCDVYRAARRLWKGS